MIAKLTKMGEQQRPYLKLTGEGVKDAATLGALLESCKNNGVIFSSNLSTENVSEKVQPYMYISLVDSPEDRDKKEPEYVPELDTGADQSDDEDDDEDDSD